MAKVETKYIPYKFDKSGETIEEIKVFQVISGGEIVNQFVPNVGNEVETLKRAEDFSNNFQELEETTPDYIIRKVKKDED